MVVRLVIADEMDLALEGVKAILRREQNIEISGAYQSLPKLLEGLTEQHPDILVVSDKLEPTMNVLKLIEQVRGTDQRVRIIVTSSVPDGLVVQELFASGIGGYLYKSDSLTQSLVEAIQTVMRHKPYLSPTANAEYLIAVQSDRAHWRIDAEARDVLQLMADGYRPQEIAMLRSLPIRRVYWIATKLRNRFGAETNAQLMIRAAEEGFLF